LRSLLCAYFSASVIAPALLYLLHPCSRCYQQKTTQYKSRKHNRAEYKQLNDFLSQLKVERIKGILKTDKGWFIINGIDRNIKYTPTTALDYSRIEIIVSQNHLQGISAKINQIYSINTSGFF